MKLKDLLLLWNVKERKIITFRSVKFNLQA